MWSIRGVLGYIRCIILINDFIFIIFVIFIILSGSESDGMKSIWDVRTCQLNEFLWCLSSNASNASNANTFQLKCRHIWQLNWGSSHRVRSQRRHWGDRNTSTQIFPFQTVCWCLLQTVPVTRRFPRIKRVHLDSLKAGPSAPEMMRWDVWGVGGGHSSSS